MERELSVLYIGNFSLHANFFTDKQLSPQVEEKMDKALALMQKNIYDCIFIDGTKKTARDLLKEARLLQKSALRVTFIEHQYPGLLHLTHLCLQSKNSEDKLNMARIQRSLSILASIQNPVLRKGLNSLKKLPSFPEAYHCIRDALEGDITTLKPVVEAIESDPALSASTLRFANSGFLGIARQVGTISDAVSLLGLINLQNLVLEQALFSEAGFVSCGSYDGKTMAERARSVAAFARKICHLEGLAKFADLGYMCGLLHEVGRLIILYNFPVQILRIDELVAERQLDCAAAEERVIGLSHSKLAAGLLSLWNLPFIIIEAIGCLNNFRHSESEEQFSECSPDNPLGAILQKACHIGDDVQGQSLLPA